jgi:hypothetical protein
MRRALESPLETSFQTGSETGFQNCLAKCKESGVPANIGFYGACALLVGGGIATKGDNKRQTGTGKKRQIATTLLPPFVAFCRAGFLSLNHCWGLVSSKFSSHGFPFFRRCGVPMNVDSRCRCRFAFRFFGVMVFVSGSARSFALSGRVCKPKRNGAARKIGGAEWSGVSDTPVECVTV